jgi:hypothetical protein
MGEKIGNMELWFGDECKYTIGDKLEEDMD